MNRNQYELYHYGVKGMKWGVRKDRMTRSQRRAAKKELKEEYSRAKSTARSVYEGKARAATKAYDTKAAAAKSAYDKTTAPYAARRDAALKNAKDEYSTLKKQTDSFYKNEIDNNMAKAERSDKDAKRWGDTRIGREEAAKANEYLERAAKAEDRYNAVTSKNLSDHEGRVIEIESKYNSETASASRKYQDALQSADRERQEQWSLAGAEYTKSIKDAKVAYKTGKKALRRKR